ncbi:EamA family transporter [Azospirillum soli]|uniref:EamA family transporter n=1 Tax=Azospirillum soli TaxID=1304799 RepID=UPI001AEA7C9B|nr:EamA family transporter [Azospirillum soli]MBP2315363.1 transporter family protein [Azospirillum soli]
MTDSLLPSWMLWALLSACFAALTAVFAKVGVEGVSSDMATLIRTAVIFPLLIGIVVASGQSFSPSAVSGKTWLFLVLSGLATGASWLCYFRALKLGPASQVAPVDKLSVVLVALFGVLFLGEKLSGPNWLGVVLIAAGVILLAFK